MFIMIGVRESRPVQNVCARVRDYMSRPNCVKIVGDFGGTHTRLGAMNNRGEILAQVDIPTQDFSSQRMLVDRLALEIDKFELAKEASFGGIGVPCPVDEKTGEPKGNTPNIKLFSLDGFFRSLSEKTGREICAFNDAQVAAMGEAMYGAGTAHDIVVFHGLGTGYGFAVVVGEKSMATEFGHGKVVNPIFDLNARRCGCGARGCAEQYVSGNALALNYQDSTAKKLTGKEVGTAFLAGDWAAKESVSRAMSYLAGHIASFHNIYLSGLHVIGGGVATLGDPLLEILKAKLAMPGVVSRPDKEELFPQVALAARPNDAGLLGAGVLAEMKAAE